MAIVNKDSPRPDFMTGRQWRSLAGRGPAHFTDRAILAAESCHAARKLG